MNASLASRMKEENFKLVSVDLFSGPGGICTGFKWGGILPLIAVEWTDSTVQTYSTTHNAEVFRLSEYYAETGPNEKYLSSYMKESTRSLLIHGDINLVSNEMIKSFLSSRYGIDSDKETVDVVSGGAPCESFSLAGTRTVGDERDDLFSNIVRISRAVNTKMILFENVKGLFSKPKDGIKGGIFNYICDTFEDPSVYPGYKLQSRNQEEILLRACDYGVPQLRERLFLIAMRKDIDGLSFSYPEKEYGPGRKYPYVTVKDAISDLPVVETGVESEIYDEPNSFISENQERYIKIMRGEFQDDSSNFSVPHHLVEEGLFSKDSISSHRGPGHVKRKRELISLIPENESMRSVFEKLTQEGTIDNYRHLFPKIIYGSRNRRLVNSEPSFTVTSHCLDEMLHPTLNRAITPREAARLQSFPDWYQFSGPYVAFHGSREQDRYEQIGDAIPPLLALAIAREMVKSIANATL